MLNEESGGKYEVGRGEKDRRRDGTWEKRLWDGDGLMVGEVVVDEVNTTLHGDFKEFLMTLSKGSYCN